MEKSVSRQVTHSLAATCIVVVAGLLLAACGSSSDGGGAGAMVEPEAPVAELGEWNTLMPGSLDISDGNQVLRAYYDDAGHGQLAAAAPVQPAGTGTAAWNGMWSGKMELNPDPLARRGLAAYGVNPDSLGQLGGKAEVIASFADGGVMAELTYRGVGLEGLDFTEITFDRVAVTGGRFEPERLYSHSFEAETANPFDPSAPATITPTTVTGNFSGAGAFGGADAAGVVGYMGGNMDIDYGRGPTRLGTFQSVFYGTRADN